MKLLFDENLPANLVEQFPGSAHVLAIGLERADDLRIWEYARHNGYAIVTKDSDFHHMSFVHGAPPFVVWLRLGNCSVVQLTNVLQRNRKRIEEFLESKQDAVLAIDH